MAPSVGAVDNETIRTTTRFWALCSTGDYEAAAEMMDRTFVHDDRRGGIGNTILGREATMANNRIVVEMGFFIDIEPVAVRGERLALVRFAARTPDGDEIVGLQVLETSANGLRSICVSFDEEHLDAAMRELDALDNWSAG